MWRSNKEPGGNKDSKRKWIQYKDNKRKLRKSKARIFGAHLTQGQQQNAWRWATLCAVQSTSVFRTTQVHCGWPTNWGPVTLAWCLRKDGNIRELSERQPNTFLPRKCLIGAKWKYKGRIMCTWAVTARSHRICWGSCPSAWQGHPCHYVRSQRPTPLTDSGPRGELPRLTSRAACWDAEHVAVWRRRWIGAAAGIPGDYVSPYFAGQQSTYCCLSRAKLTA
jgi:hypothetical protein